MATVEPIEPARSVGGGPPTVRGKSISRETSTARPQPAGWVVTRADVVVVGGGIVGLCCAYALRRRGLSVVMVERGEPGAGASSVNAGWIVPSFSAPVPAPEVRRTALRWLLNPNSPLRINPRADPGLARWLWRFWRACRPTAHARGLAAIARLNCHTLALYDALAADGVRFDLERRGVLFAFRDEAAARAELDELERVARHGFARPVWLDGRAVRAEEPAMADSVVAGVLAPDECHVEPGQIVRGLVARLCDLGVEIRAGQAVTGLPGRRTGRSPASPGGARAEGVRTGAGQVAAGAVVTAAGAWSGRLARLAGFSLPMLGGRGYSLTYRPAPLTLRRPLYLAEARVACTPFASGLRLAGLMELCALDDPFEAGRGRLVSAAAPVYLRAWPAGSPSPPVEAGFRPMTPDGLPVIGRVPGWDNLFIATGHAMLGLTLGPATGEAIADLVTGQAPRHDLRPFAPERFLRRPGRLAAIRPRATAPGAR